MTEFSHNKILNISGQEATLEIDPHVGAVTIEGRTLVFTAHTIGENEIVHHGPQTWVWVYRASMGAFPYPGQYEAAGKKLSG